MIQEEEKLTFSQFLDLLLVRLYELEMEQGADRFFDLHQINSTLQRPLPDQWVLDAGNVLASRGLVQEAFTFDGLDARIAGEGRLLVEEKKDQQRSIVKRYYDNPQDFVNKSVVDSQNVIAAGSGNARVTSQSDFRRADGPGLRLLEEIRTTLESDHAISAEKKQAALEDVQLVRQQLERREPNRTVLAAVLQPLSQIASIAGHVASLIRLINL